MDSLTMQIKDLIINFKEKNQLIILSTVACFKKKKSPFLEDTSI
jgi:hypothetical protein